MIKQKPLFSVVIPTHQRPEAVKKAVDSVLTQTEQDLEVIVVDDYSPEDTFKVLKDIKDPRFNYIRLGARQQRLIARNVGIRASNGTWLCMLDDDDWFEKNYLEEFKKAILKQPKLSVFICTALFIHKNGDNGRVIPAIAPPLNPAKTDPIYFDDGVYAWFKSGRITMGQFIFHRNCLDTIGYFPETASYGEFAEVAGIPGYGKREPDSRHDKPWVHVLGNPFGDDFFLFYKLTRHYLVGTVPKILVKKRCR